MNATTEYAAIQAPLVHIVESDDHFLAEADVAWFRILSELDWRPLVEIGVQYYEALWAFNQSQLQERSDRERSCPPPNPETREEAQQRLLLERATLDSTRPVLAEITVASREPLHVDPTRLRPGRVPGRLWGRNPKDFFSMIKAFLGLVLMGRPAEPELVHAELTNNPAFARTCGFTLPAARLGYRATDVPSLRKLEQFDQIMTATGLWGHLAVQKVRDNLARGKLEITTLAVHDTTHHKAFSSMEVPVVEGKLNKDGKPLKKSHPKTTKACRCHDWNVCPHPWISADEGAGTVVKAEGKKYWGHKASILAVLGDIEIPFDAVAMTDAASHDSRSLIAHIERLQRLYPELVEKLRIILDDSALDDERIRRELKERFEIDLRAPPNPRGRKPIVADLPRGIDRITPNGTPVCAEGFPFELLGVRKQEERFLFQAPDGENALPVCTDCTRRDGCIRSSAQRRHLSIPFRRLPFMDPEFPHLSKRFQQLLANRTVIERVIKLMKFDYGSDRLTKRGTPAYQATLEKTLFAMHVVLAQS